jgi:hypothetical protein
MLLMSTAPCPLNSDHPAPSVAIKTTQLLDYVAAACHAGAAILPTQLLGYCCCLPCFRCHDTDQITRLLLLLFIMLVLPCRLFNCYVDVAAVIQQRQNKLLMCQAYFLPSMARVRLP